MEHQRWHDRSCSMCKIRWLKSFSSGRKITSTQSLSNVFLLVGRLDLQGWNPHNLSGLIFTILHHSDRIVTVGRDVYILNKPSTRTVVASRAFSVCAPVVWKSRPASVCAPVVWKSRPAAVPSSVHFYLTSFSYLWLNWQVTKCLWIFGLHGTINIDFT